MALAAALTIASDGGPGKEASGTARGTCYSPLQTLTRVTGHAGMRKIRKARRPQRMAFLFNHFLKHP